MNHQPSISVHTVPLPSVMCKACGCRKAEVGKDTCGLCRRREEYHESVRRNIEALR